MQTEASVDMLRRNERLTASEWDAAMSGGGRETERTKSGIKSVRVRLRIAFPYRVTALVCLSRSFQRFCSVLSFVQHEWRRHGMRSRDVSGAGTATALDALHLRARFTIVLDAFELLVSIALIIATYSAFKNLI